MCESDVFKGEEKIMENAVTLAIKDNKMFLENINGEQKELSNAVIDHIDFIKHKVVLR